VTEDYAIYSPDYLGLAARAIDEYCRQLQPMLNFELLRTSADWRISPDVWKTPLNQ
jgi:hypothetical protein